MKIGGSSSTNGHKTLPIRPELYDVLALTSPRNCASTVETFIQPLSLLPILTHSYQPTHQTHLIPKHIIQTTQKKWDYVNLFSPTQTRLSYNVALHEKEQLTCHKSK